MLCLQRRAAAFSLGRLTTLMQRHHSQAKMPPLLQTTQKS
jgi:hypothetical protein